ncbi:MAG: hypothetical protein JW811_04955 [Clostridiales bacterium]|nr:hypothetical protein [Clostridiales bacterium]
MYRLLIVTKSPTIEKMFSDADGWETMGFKPPRVRKTFEEAVECLRKHHIDAIGIDEGFETLEQWMDEKQPQIPVFMIIDDKEQQLTIIREVELLLNQIHTDNSDVEYNEETNFSAARERWMKYLLSRLAPTKKEILKQQRLYRCSDDPQSPCFFARISIPQGDMFITERWHYGSERLATALRNFFGEEYEMMNIHIAVVSPEEVRIVFSPRSCGAAGVTPDMKVKAYIEETIGQIQHYLGLTMSLAELKTLNGLIDFAADCTWSEEK